MRRVSLFILLALIPFSSAHAIDEFEVKGLQPLPPFGIFSTFSAESLPQKKFGFGLSLERSFDPDYYVATANVAVGILDNLELNAQLPYVSGWENGVSGPEDFSIGIKHRLLDEGKLYPSIAYLVDASLGTGKDEFSTDGGFGGGLLLSKKVGPFKGHFNFLYFNPQKSGLKERYLFNAGVELAIAHNSKILGELVGRKDFFKNRLNLLEWRLGYRLAATDDIFASVGVGFDIKNRTPDYRLLFSLSFILPREKKEIRKIYE